MPHVVLVPGFTQTATSWDGVREIVDGSNDVTAIDAVTADAANMAADVQFNQSDLNADVGGNSSAPAKPKRPHTAPAPDEPAANSSAPKPDANSTE